MAKKTKPGEKLRRGDAFVEEPTGSAPRVNLDGRHEAGDAEAGAAEKSIKNGRVEGSD
ncbi:MAG: hypothetical protein MJA84_02135 [Firmicutes bacterium]|nr:hypothetical protein [Bacillota bacterium]